jgi:hypothetical protein
MSGLLAGDFGVRSAARGGTSALRRIRGEDAVRQLRSVGHHEPDTPQTSDCGPFHGARHYEPAAAIETGTAIAGSVLARRALFLTLLVTPNENDSPSKPESNARMTYVPPMLAMSR